MEERGSAVSSPQPNNVRILLVSGRNDEPLRAAAEAIEAAGVALTIAADAYAALARLSTGPPFDYLLLDARDMDDAELGIVQVASRYYPSVPSAVLMLNGTEARMARS